MNSFSFIFLQTVALWDLRNLKLKLHTFESHKDEIFQVCDSFLMSVSDFSNVSVEGNQKIFFLLYHGQWALFFVVVLFFFVHTL